MNPGMQQKGQPSSGKYRGYSRVQFTAQLWRRWHNERQELRRVQPLPAALTLRPRGE